ncbi:Autophagy-related protein 11 [Spathaspora sp. JA1]|nr:Autophagy-related protein 11 [Spathaspora sp. JA1]
MISDISYLIIYNSHNGHSFKIPKPIRFHNVKDFKRFIQSSLFNEVSPDDNLFLLTSFGIRLNFNLINDINEVFVYDKRLFVEDVDFGVFDQFQQEQEVAGVPSVPVAKATSVKDMSNHLKLVGNWSRGVIQQVEQLQELNNSLIASINIIFKSLNVIFQFMNNFINEIEVNFNNYFNYIKLIQFKTLHKSWEPHYKKLSSLPGVKINQHYIKLSDLIELNKLRSYASYIGKYLPLIINKFNSLNSTIKTINESDKLTIDKYIEQLRNKSIEQFKNSTTPKNLERYANTISSDIDKLSQDSSQLESIYKSHKEVSGSLYQGATAIYSHYHELYQFKQKLSRDCLLVFNNIAKVQMNMVNVKTELKHLTSEEKEQQEISLDVINTVKKYEDYLSLTIDLPLLFGFILIEKRRQFEWFDFYSRGIVNNLSEQLSTIINHEKLFRSIWIKKFGNFLKLLNDTAQFNIVLPNIDITLLSNKDKANPFTILQDIEVDRTDIVNYIQLVETQGLTSFVDLLNKNHKDLIQSTNNLKKITKLITSLSNYTSISNQEHSKFEIENSEVDFDLNLIKGLKSRIKKLENLLHQQQVKNLNNWPTSTTANGTARPTNGRVAVSGSVMLLDQKNKSPTQLLRSSSTSEKVVSPTSIDKHLDNIRLKKVNTELSLQVDELTQANTDKDEIIAKLTEEIKSLTSNKQTIIQETTDKDQQIANLTTTVQSQKEQLQSQTELFEKHKQETSQEILGLNKIISNLRTELNDAIHIKNELLSNLASKETEFTKERSQFDQDVKTVKNQLESVQEDYENLLELTSIRQDKYDSGLDSLNEVVMTWVKKLMGLVFDYIIEYCLILESMGLLLVKDGDKFVIKRVKGLRTKNESQDVPSSEVIDEVMSKMKFIEEMTTSTPDKQSQEDVDTSKYKSVISPFQDNSNNFNSLIDLLSFKDNITLQEDTTSTKFFLNAISKRFKDVEGFAKRQTKENKLNQTELKKLLFKLRSKISMTGFTQDDLLLFLPTRIEREQPEKSNIRPWAAFNIGTPHYFLNVTDEIKDRDWIIARVKNITEFKVTEDTFDDITLNPFRLSVGVVWYLVDAEEEK